MGSLPTASKVDIDLWRPTANGVCRLPMKLCGESLRYCHSGPYGATSLVTNAFDSKFQLGRLMPRCALTLSVYKHLLLQQRLAR